MDERQSIGDATSTGETKLPDEANMRQGKTLLLVPTETEAKLVVQHLPQSCGFEILLAGFGPVAAAARTSQLIAEHNPGQMILLGIAGGYTVSAEIGSAFQYERVSCHGIGCGFDHESSTKTGFSQISIVHFKHGGIETSVPDGSTGESDTLPLATIGNRSIHPLLLTVCSASANQAEVDMKLASNPTACAEDMEGFGFALACHLYGVLPTIIRGISNSAGNRDKQQWQIEPAIKSAIELLLDVS